VEPEEVLEAFRKAVEVRQYADVPRAAFLSGGIDSSAIVSGYVALNIDLLPCIVRYAGGDEQQNEDLPFACYMAEWLGLRPVCVAIQTGDFAALVEAVIRRIQRPAVHGAELAMYSCYELISRLGRTVTYAGHGADEMWGYQDGLYFPMLAPSFRPDMHSQYYLSRHLYQDDPPGWHPFLQRYFYPLFGLTESTIRELIWERTLAAYREPDYLDPHQRARYHMCRRFLVYINQMVDALSMGFSLEERPVFQDLYLAALSFRLPEFRKNREGPTNFKPFLKRALAPLLPEKVISRRKVGFQPPPATTVTTKPVSANWQTGFLSA
jgi:asparagine synthase (glutamine-hydrolysing)